VNTKIMSAIANISKIPNRPCQPFRRLFSSSSREETVGVWVFHRHGDRTPSRPLVSEEFVDEEADFWRSKIPPVDRTHYQILSERFPASIHESYDAKFLDADCGREPYGFLSYKGMTQMYQKGREMAKRFNPDSSSSSKNQITDAFEVKAYSTNYLRTVKSCQCFLDGLLSPSSRIDLGANDDNYETLYENIDPNDYQDHSGITIQVRNRKNDTLNAFDKSPTLMKSLVKDVVSTDHFIDRDTKAATVAARLCNFLPGLMNCTSYGGPSGINWIHASDHFVCRHSHELPLSKFSNLECDASEQTLQAMSHFVTSHLAWRFRTWYQSPALLAAIAGPPLANVKDQMNTIVNNKGKRDKKPFMVYSCHDVTILSLLYGLGTDFVASDDEIQELGLGLSNEKSWRFWPEYASTLLIELVRVSAQDIEDEYVVKVMLNGETIRTITALKQGNEFMNLSDFNVVTTELNEAAPQEL